MTEQTSRLAIVIDSSGAEKQADNLATALVKMTQAGERAATSAAKVTKATDEEKQSLSELLDRIDPVNAALNKLDKQQQDLAKFKSKGMVDADTFDLYSKKIEETRNRLTGFRDDLGKTGQSAAQTAFAMRMIPAQMTDIVVGLSTGQSPFMVLMQQGGQLKDMFGGIGPAIKGVGGYVLGLINPVALAAAAVGVLGLAYYKGSQEQDEFYKSLTLSGNLVGKTTGQLADMAARVSVVANSTTGVSAATLNQIVSSGKVAAESLERVTTAVVEISEATGIATEKLVGDFNDIAADPVAAITKLNDQYHFLTLATYNQIKALQDEGNQQDAARVATDAYANAMQQRANDIHQNLGILERAWDSLAKTAKGAWDAMLDIGREQTGTERISQIRKELDWIDKAAGGKLFFGGRKAELEDELNNLQSQITTEGVLTEIISSHDKAEQKRIKTQQEADRVNQQLLSNADIRNQKLKQQSEFLKSGAITAEQYAKNVSRINELYKDPKPPKTPKGKAYTEDAATRLLDQINQQTAAMQS
ncbi:MAG: phage tail length tape measure family protein, partial [Enterobacter hormaechei]|nr:phage tail length tape measure family protein [Enterobacter hormaechei]